MSYKKVFACFLLSLLLCSVNLAAQWEASLNSLLEEVKNCQPPVSDNAPCSFITSQAVKAVYGIDDFATSGANGSLCPASQIDDLVENSPQWSLLGRADNQEALTLAQETANAGKAVLAILDEEPQGHVVLILPGELTPSGKWQLSTPNSASFFLNVPRLSYVGKPLSYAFKEPGKVELYAKTQ